MRLLVFLCLLSCPAWAAGRWDMQFFHDVNNESLHLNAIGFCSSTRGVAAGVLQRERSLKPTVVVTSNGGKTWSMMETEEVGQSLFFLDETSGWMITKSGVWFTDECGRSWRRILKRQGLTAVHFLSRERGWAIGTKATFLETNDGGRTWAPVKAAESLTATPDRVIFDAIDFSNAKAGVVAGKLRKAREPGIPLWLDLEPERRRERPLLSYLMETRDSGTTWSANKISMFGRVSRVKFSKAGVGLALIEFDDYFEFSSELHQLGKGSVLRKKDLALTDLALLDSLWVAAGFLPSGPIFRSPVPGKVRIVRSSNMTDWIEDEVDYRAVATRVMLAESNGQLWAATDTGMILKLAQ
jgi:hypothetical protein